MFGKKKEPIKKNGKNAIELLAELDAQVKPKESIIEVKDAPKDIPKEEKISTGKKNGNGKAKSSAIQETVEIKPAEIEIQERKIAERNAMIEADNKRRFYESIPGYGYLFGIKKEFLPESTNIDKGQAWTIALGYMGEDMLNPNRTESLFELFAERLMRLQNSVEGKSRTDVLEARRQEAEKAAAGAVREGLAGGR